MVAPSLGNDAEGGQSALLEPEEPSNKAHAVGASSSLDDDSAAADTGTVDPIITAPPAPQSDQTEPPSFTSVLQRSRRSTANYQQDYSSEGIIPVEEGGALLDDANDDSLTSSNLTLDQQIIISMKDPNYKSFLHSYFQNKLSGDNVIMPNNNREDQEDEKQVREEVLTLLKKAGGGTFWNYVDFRHPEKGVVEVEERVARTSEYRCCA